MWGGINYGISQVRYSSKMASNSKKRNASSCVTSSLPISYYYASKDKIESLLNDCVMSSEEQDRYHSYTNEREREEPISDIPLRAYSVKAFVKRLSEYILELENRKMLHIPYDEIEIERKKDSEVYVGG